MGQHEDGSSGRRFEEGKGVQEVYHPLEAGDGTAEKTSSLRFGLQAIKIDRAAERGGREDWGDRD